MWPEKHQGPRLLLLLLLLETCFRDKFQQNNSPVPLDLGFQDS